MTPEVIREAQELFNSGLGKAEVARRMEIKPDTLLKALQSGRLTEGKKKQTRSAQKAIGAE